MKKFVLDTNCLLEIDESRVFESDLKCLIALHGRGKVNLSINAISASENQKGGTHLILFGDFERRLEGWGVNHLPLLMPFGIWDSTFFDKFIWSDENDVDLIKRIHSILFPHIEFDWNAFAARTQSNPQNKSTREYMRWRNAICDSQMAWAAIHYEQDALVTTNTKQFQANLNELNKIGLCNAILPSEAVSLILND